MTDSEKRIVGVVYQKYEAAAYRSMEAENLLVDIMQMNWFKRLFLRKKIIKFLKEQSDKYYEIENTQF